MQPCSNIIIMQHGAKTSMAAAKKKKTAIEFDSWKVYVV